PRLMVVGGPRTALTSQRPDHLRVHAPHLAVHAARKLAGPPGGRGGRREVADEGGVKGRGHPYGRAGKLAGMAMQQPGEREMRLDLPQEIDATGQPVERSQPRWAPQAALQTL